MTQNEQNRNLDDAIRALKTDEPDAGDMSHAMGRLALRLEGENSPEPVRLEGCADVQQLLPRYFAGQLPASRTLVIKMHLLECVACRQHAKGEAAGTVDWSALLPARKNPRPKGLRIALAFAMAGVAAAALFVYSAYFAVPAGARASVQSLDGQAYRISASGTRPVVIGDELADGEVLRTAAGSHTYLRLQDGSTLEVRERSEFAVSSRGRNMTVDLGQGAVIVQAAHRQTGHLYVRTPDARVAVTGTVFSVNAGIKGSRVAVMEGTVRVAHAGLEDVLHAGDQVATGANMDAVSVPDEIAWSHDREKHLALLAQFATLRHRLEQLPLPGLRYSSDLLDRVPKSTVLYISIPNMGEVLSRSNEIFQEQLRVSPELQAWWTRGNGHQEDLNATVARIRTVSQYLGDEIVIVGLASGKSPEVAAIADIQRPGLADYLRSQVAGISGSRGLLVVEPDGLGSLAAGAGNRDQVVVLVRQSEVVFSSSVSALRLVNAQLDAGGGGISSSEFGRQISAVYNHGAGLFLAADVGRILRNGQRRSGRHDAAFERSGFAGLRYVLAEHREPNGVPDNHLNLQFEGERQGVASWLAAPAPMGSLDFVSANAALSLSMISKEPRAIVDDMLQLASAGHSTAERDWNELQDKLQVRLQEDLAAQLGGDVAFALDGPVLPTPAWKLVLEVHDSSRLQDTLQRIVQSISGERQRQGHPGIAIDVEDAGGQRFYSIRGTDHGPASVDYTFADGYMIVAGSRAILMAALKTHASGDSLGRSARFRSLLPKDENLDYSAIAYQNLSPILQPLLSQVRGGQAEALQQLAADARPTAVCLWGKENQIEAASNSRLLGLDLFTLFSLMDLENKTQSGRVQQKQ